jgi:hypothetical protein
MASLSRRGLITGLIAFAATPAIVRASSLMKVVPSLQLARNDWLTLSEINREAIQLWRNSNLFLHNIERQFQDSFALPKETQVGTKLHIRLPDKVAA